MPTTHTYTPLRPFTLTHTYLAPPTLQSRSEMHQQRRPRSDVPVSHRQCLLHVVPWCERTPSLRDGAEAAGPMEWRAHRGSVKTPTNQVPIDERIYICIIFQACVCMYACMHVYRCVCLCACACVEWDVKLNVLDTISIAPFMHVDR